MKGKYHQNVKSENSQKKIQLKIRNEYENQSLNRISLRERNYRWNSTKYEGKSVSQRRNPRREKEIQENRNYNSKREDLEVMMVRTRLEMQILDS